jgi:hypothetical protein
MDSVSISGTIYKVPFTVTITSSTELTITSNDIASWANKPNITNGALVYPINTPATNVSQSSVIASSDSHVQTGVATTEGNVIIGGNASSIVNGAATDNANGANYPSYSLVIGANNISKAPAQFVYGVGCRPINSGQSVRSYGFFAAAGDRQVSQCYAAVTTADGAANGTTCPYSSTGIIPGQNYLLAPNKVYLVEGYVVAAQTAGTGGAGANVAGYIVRGVVHSSSVGALTIKSQSTTVVHEDQGPWDVSLAVFSAAGLGGQYTTNNQGILRFNCTGDAARTVRWFIDCKLVEVGFT